MNKFKYAAALFAVLSAPAFAGNSATSQAQTQAQSSAANMGVNAVVQSYGGDIPDHTFGVLLNNPATVTPSSGFGWSPQNCGGSDSKTFSTLIGSFGESVAKEMLECNNRQDAILSVQLGMQRVAILRMYCFGSDANRMAYEAAGNVCPSSATAKGIPGAPVGPKIMATGYVPQTLYGKINADGTITYRSKR